MKKTQRWNTIIYQYKIVLYVTLSSNLNDWTDYSYSYALKIKFSYTVTSLLLRWIKTSFCISYFVFEASFSNTFKFDLLYFWVIRFWVGNDSKLVWMDTNTAFWRIYHKTYLEIHICSFTLWTISLAHKLKKNGNCYHKSNKLWTISDSLFCYCFVLSCESRAPCLSEPMSIHWHVKFLGLWYDTYW